MPGRTPVLGLPYHPAFTCPDGCSVPPFPIKAITFDLDETLWPVWPTILRAERALHDWLAENAPRTFERFPVDALRALRDEIARTRADLAHDVAGMRRASITLALERAGDDPALAVGAWDAFMTERQRVEPFADALPALETLAARYPLATITNGNADVNRIGIGHLFQANFSAAEVGFGKPDPRIFHMATAALGVAPHEVLHVGDDPHLDVIGAQAAGLRGVWINRPGDAWSHEVTPHHHFRDLAELVRWIDEAHPSPTAVA